jgi:hypothetical protein
MHQSTIRSASEQQKPQRSPLGRLLRTALPAAAFGALVWLSPSVSEAAPRCSSKPAVCHRLAAAEKAQARAARPAVAAPRATVVAQNDKARCNTKPSVCARLDATASRRAVAPVTLAQDFQSGPRCTTKPAVCARLKLRETAKPMTLASE